MSLVEKLNSLQYSSSSPDVGSSSSFTCPSFSLQTSVALADSVTELELVATDNCLGDLDCKFFGFHCCK